MMKENLLRVFYVNVDMASINKKVDTKATFKKLETETGVLIFQLNFGELLDLTDCRVSANIVKNNKETTFIDCQVIEPKQGLVIMGLNSSALECTGKTYIELIVTYKNQKLFSPIMYYTVVDTLQLPSIMPL